MAKQPIINIVIAYAGGRSDFPDPGVATDKRWKALRAFAVKAHRAALSRCAKRFQQMRNASPDYVEDESTEWPAGIAHYPGRSAKVKLSIVGAYIPVTRRLRAGAGMFIWEDVLRRIKDADVLIFDLTPREGDNAPSPNVLLELGAAMILHPRKPVFPVVDQRSRITKLLPSDLAGLIVGVVANEDKIQDRALYAAVAEQIAGCVERKFNPIAQSI